MGVYQPGDILGAISNAVGSSFVMLDPRLGHEVEFTDRYGDTGVLAVVDADDRTLQRFNIVVTELDGEVAG